MRNRLSILWLSGTAISITTEVLELLSGAKEGVTMGPEILFVLSIIALVGPSMASLSQVLEERTNRRVNIVMGIAIEVFAAAIFVVYLETIPAIALDPAVGLVFPALVVWYAWKSKQTVQ